MHMLGKVGFSASIILGTLILAPALVPAQGHEVFGAVLDGCIGDENYIFVNADKARSLVPDEFVVFGTASPLPVHETGLFHYHAVHCDAVTIGASVLHDQTYVDFGIGVDPVDDAWLVTNTNYYTIGFFVSSPEWAEYLNLGGIPAQVADFERIIAPGLVNDVPDVHVWQVSTPEVSFTFDFRLLKVILVQARYHYSLWFGSGPFTRLDNDMIYGATILEAQTLLTQGTGPIADLTGPVRAGDASSYLRWDGPWSWIPGEFV